MLFFNSVYAAGRRNTKQEMLWTASWHCTFFLFKQHFYKQRQTEICKILSKTPQQHSETGLLRNMPQKRVSLCQWSYMINCSENGNHNGK